MGKIGKFLATGLLAASLALGINSGVSMNEIGNKLNRDPDYITANEINKVRLNVLYGVRDIYGEKGEDPSLLNPVPLYPVKNGGYVLPPNVVFPGRRERLPDIKKAQEEIRQAEKYIKPIQKKLDNGVRIRNQLEKVEESLSSTNPSTNSDFQKEGKILYEVVSDLSEARINHMDQAYENVGFSYNMATGIIGVFVSIAGGAGALVKLVDEKKKDNLEGKVNKSMAFVSIAGLLGGIFFLSGNITGNAITNLTIKTSSFLGAGLFILGLASGFFWVKSKNK